MISKRLKQAILRELDLEDFNFTDNTVAAEVPGWDSLSHVRVLSGVEKEFGIRFRTLEVLSLKSVGELQTLIQKKSETDTRTT